MTVADVEIIARTLMDKHGLHEWRFEWDRAVRRAGCCKYRSKRITLSWYYVTHNLHNLVDIVDTILHEVRILHLILCLIRATHGVWTAQKQN